MSKRPFSRYSPVSQSVQDAFEYHVSPEPNSGCWLWTGPVFSHRGGYGCFTMRSAGLIQQRAHRVSWSIYCHEISSEAHVLHACDNPTCVNPAHLFLGTQTSNMEDKVAKRRQDRGERHGMHKLTENDAIAIRSDPRQFKEIAEEYGVSVPTISDIKCGRSWAHLGPPVRRYRRAA